MRKKLLSLALATVLTTGSLSLPILNTETVSAHIAISDPTFIEKGKTSNMKWSDTTYLKMKISKVTTNSKTVSSFLNKAPNGDEKTRFNSDKVGKKVALLRLNIKNQSHSYNIDLNEFDTYYMTCRAELPEGIDSNDNGTLITNKKRVLKAGESATLYVLVAVPKNAKKAYLRIQPKDLDMFDIGEGTWLRFK